MKRYTLSPEAQQDLRDIRDYLLEEAGLFVARRVARDIAKAIRMLSDLPQHGHLREDLTDEPVRFRSVFSYLVIYDPTSRPVGIARVIHASRDIKDLLRRWRPPSQ